MSKIRDLFEKFKKKKSKESEDTDHTGDIDITEFANSDEIDMQENLPNEMVRNDDFDEDDLDEDDSTIDESIDDLPPSDIPPLEMSVPSEEEEEEESDFDDEIPTLPPADQTGDYTTEIDLVNGKVPFKDRLQMTMGNLKTTIKDKVNRINFRKVKDFKFQKGDATEDGANDGSTKSKLNITLPPALQRVEEELKQKLKTVNWKNIHNEFFKSSHRNKYHRVFQITALVMLTYTVGKTTGLILTGSNDYKNLNKISRLDIDKTNELKTKSVNQLKKAKLFKTDTVKVTTTKVKPIVNEVATCTKASGKSRLPIKLVNTIVLQDEVKSIASVQVRSESVLRELRVGEKIDGMAKIGRITRQGLIVKNLKSGICESIINEKSKDDMDSPIAVLSPSASKTFKKKLKKIKGVENDGNNFTIEKSFLKNKMSNINSILTQARGVQINNPDGSISFKIVDIEPGGIFAHLGIEDGDIITQINGKKISDLNEIMSLFGKITNIDQLSLNVKRGGENTPLDYKFK